MYGMEPWVHYKRDLILGGIGCLIVLGLMAYAMVDIYGNCLRCHTTDNITIGHSDSKSRNEQAKNKDLLEPSGGSLIYFNNMNQLYPR